MSDTTTYTMLPAAAMGKLEPYLKENNIPYEEISVWDTPENLPEECVWHGHVMKKHLTCVKSNIPSDKLLKMAEELY